MNAKATLEYLQRVERVKRDPATGKVRWRRTYFYARYQGKRQPILPPDGMDPAEFEGSIEFVRRYLDALELARGDAMESKRQRGSHGSLDWLLGLYFASTSFQGLGEGTQGRHRRILEEFANERPAATRAVPKPAAFGAQPVARFKRKLFVGLLGRWQLPKPDHPNPKARKGGIEAANNRLRAVKRLFGWAVDAEHVDANPVRDVKLLENNSGGFHTWTVAEIRTFLERWPLRTAPGVALFVILCTGARRSDAWRLAQSMVEDGRLRFVPFKTRNNKRRGGDAVVVEIPFLAVLANAIAGLGHEHDQFVVGLRGRPFGSAASFGNAFSEWCNKAGLEHCAAHGLRKGGASFLAELGLTPFQLNAIYGWTGLAMATVYTERADRRVQAEALGQLDEALAQALELDRASVPEVAPDAVVVVEGEDEADV